jgi:transposase
MKYIKKYENRFTNFFKSDGSDDFFQEFMDTQLERRIGYTPLMTAASEGNWKKFKRLFPVYKDKINIPYSKGHKNKYLLFYVIKGDGDLWEKKKMLSLLFDNNVDFIVTDSHNNTFFDYIKDIKLKKWIEENYPNVVSQLTANKYNL